ncbi:MAG: sterol desaturase family protein [Dehalococcoidia bacterium]|nr:sterol desaturase family protein [Dehalococcoidia bacterium]
MVARLVVLVAVLAVLSVVFGVLEWLWPSVRGQRRRRPGLGTDIAWWFWDPLVNKTISFIGVVAVVVPIALVLTAGMEGDTLKAKLEARETWLSAQPLWLQSLQLLVLFDVLGYWSHRAFHRVEMLWRYHAVHHSSRELDWLSAVRVHPVNELGTRVVQSVPVVVLGYDTSLVAAFVPLLAFYAIGLHANLRWNFGWFKYVIASPVFHRWHHTTELEGLDRNFAGMFPVLDVVFGTLYFPKDRQPLEFGILGDLVPDNLLRQIAYPWKARARA